MKDPEITINGIPVKGIVKEPISFNLQETKTMTITLAIDDATYVSMLSYLGEKHCPFSVNFGF